MGNPTVNNTHCARLYSALETKQPEKELDNLSRAIGPEQLNTLIQSQWETVAEIIFESTPNTAAIGALMIFESGRQCLNPHLQLAIKINNKAVYEPLFKLFADNENNRPPGFLEFLNQAVEDSCGFTNYSTFCLAMNTKLSVLGKDKLIESLPSNQIGQREIFTKEWMKQRGLQLPKESNGSPSAAKQPCLKLAKVG